MSCLGLTARSVSDRIPEDLAWLLAISAKFPKRDIEEAIVKKLLREAPGEAIGHIRARIAASEFRVISASRAERLMKEKLFERVFALRQRAFTSAFRNPEIDMHFSLTQEMMPIREFLALVAAESPQRLTVLLEAKSCDSVSASVKSWRRSRRYFASQPPSMPTMVPVT